MIDVSAVGRSSLISPTPAADKPMQPQSSFGAALDATARRKVDVQRKESVKDPTGLSLEEWKEFRRLTDLDKLRLETGRLQGTAKTLADQCRAALDELEKGDDSGSAWESFRQAYDELVRATERAYGHLPHDSLTRILAMAEYAQKEGGFTK